MKSNRISLLFVPFVLMLLLVACQEEETEVLSVVGLDKTSDTVGAEVTIYGTAFSTEVSKIEVQFGSVPATVILATPDHILVTVPNGSTQGPVSVTVANQTADHQPEFTTLDYVDERDQQRYPLVYIEEQIWIGKHLNYNTIGGDACFELQEENCETEGRFYIWTTAQDICPYGWKLPAVSDYEKLLLAVNNDEGMVLRDGGDSGFDIVRSGAYYQLNKDIYQFYGRNEFVNLWTSTDRETDGRQYVFSYPYHPIDHEGSFFTLSKQDYACVRCLKED